MLYTPRAMSVDQNHYQATATADATDVASPCIGVCKLRTDGVCRGCGRTGAEIGRWRDASPAERADILELSRARLATTR